MGYVQTHCGVLVQIDCRLIDWLAGSAGGKCWGLKSPTDPHRRILKPQSAAHFPRVLMKMGGFCIHYLRGLISMILNGESDTFSQGFNEMGSFCIFYLCGFTRLICENLNA